MRWRFLSTRFDQNSWGKLQITLRNSFYIQSTRLKEGANRGEFLLLQFQRRNSNYVSLNKTLIANQFDEFLKILIYLFNETLKTERNFHNYFILELLITS